MNCLSIRFIVNEIGASCEGLYLSCSKLITSLKVAGSRPKEINELVSTDITLPEALGPGV
jgi:hypothetical protein